MNGTGNWWGRKSPCPPPTGKSPSIADEYVDLEFGTGAVKITPAHDPNDYEVGQRHNLEQIVVIGLDGKMTREAGKYEGEDRYECRKHIVQDLKDMGLLVKIEDAPHSVGHCQRCHHVVEPMVSTQWFVKMKPLAEAPSNASPRATRNSCPAGSPRPISSGWKTSMTGAFPGRSGGATGSRSGTATTAGKWLPPGRT